MISGVNDAEVSLFKFWGAASADVLMEGVDVSKNPWRPEWLQAIGWGEEIDQRWGSEI